MMIVNANVSRLSREIDLPSIHRHDIPYSIPYILVTALNIKNLGKQLGTLFLQFFR